MRFNAGGKAFGGCCAGGGNDRDWTRDGHHPAKREKCGTALVEVMPDTNFLFDGIECCSEWSIACTGAKDELIDTDAETAFDEFIG